MPTTPPVVHYPAFKLRRRTSGTLLTPKAQAGRLVDDSNEDEDTANVEQRALWSFKEVQNRLHGFAPWDVQVLQPRQFSL